MRRPNSTTFFSSRAGSGFTVIELLVAVAITAAMAAVMLAMTSNIMSSWMRASGSLSAQTQARTALDYLQRDLERAIFRRDGNVWFAVDTIRDPDSQQPPNLWQPIFENPDRTKPSEFNRDARDAAWDPERNRFGWAGVWLRFFTADPEVNAVSYQIVRRTPVKTQTTPSMVELDARARYMLYRSKAGSETTFSKGYNIVGDRYNNSFNFVPDDSADGAREANDNPESDEEDFHDIEAADIQFPSRDTLVGSNVVDFGIRLFWRTVNSAGETVYMEIFPDPRDPENPAVGGGDENLAHRSPALPGNTPEPTASNDMPNYTVYENDNEDIEGRQVPNNASTRIPNVAEITIRVLTDQGATLLANYEAGRIEGDWWDIVEENSKIFTRRVVLRNAPESR